jgi:hypothetical protein
VALAAVRIGVSDTGVRKLATKAKAVTSFRPSKKALSPRKENKCIDGGNREGVPLGSRTLVVSSLLNFTSNN